MAFSIPLHSAEVTYEEDFAEPEPEAEEVAAVETEAEEVAAVDAEAEEVAAVDAEAEEVAAVEEAQQEVNDEPVIGTEEGEPEEGQQADEGFAA